MDNFVFLLVLESKYYMAYTWKNPLMGWKGWLTLLGVGGGDWHLWGWVEVIKAFGGGVSGDDCQASFILASFRMKWLLSNLFCIWNTDRQIEFLCFLKVCCIILEFIFKLLCSKSYKFQTKKWGQNLTVWSPWIYIRLNRGIPWWV